MNREMLKEAIAEAKTIKETAIANAKLALEEAFTPQLTAMFAEKLNELDEEEKVEEGAEEMYSENEEMEETFNLDEILAELEMTEETEEVKETEDIDEELMLEEMSDEEIEELVIQVIDDMIASGKLMAGEETEEEESEEEMEMNDMEMDSEEETEEETEDIDIEELLGETDSEKEKVEEVDLGSLGNMLDQAMATADAGKIALAVASAVAGGVTVNAIKNYIQDKLSGKKIKEAGAEEMEETINELRNELNEVNLLNAKLLYTNKIFKAKNLTESDKVKVLNAFDKAVNVKEVKLVFETLTESLKTKTTKAPIKESFGSASKTITPATPKQPIVEVNEAFLRMQKIAGIIK